jgi:hypothetical protein
MRPLFRRTLILTAAVAVAATIVLPAAPASAGGGCNATVRTARALRRAVHHRPQGAVICIRGTIRLRGAIEPKHRQVFAGPGTVRAASPRVDIGFNLDKASGVVIRRLNISGFELRAIQCGRKAMIKRNRIHHNRRNGIGGGNCAGLKIVRNEIDNNGGRNHLGSGSAGVKLAGDADGTTVLHNFVHHNIGNGLWWDADARHALAARNKIVGNTRKGINYEVSGGPAVFRYNVIKRNNKEYHRDSAGIVVTSSRRVRIVHNEFGRNKNAGIKIDNAGGRGFPLADITVRWNRMRGDDVRCDDGHNVTCQR